MRKNQGYKIVKTFPISDLSNFKDHRRLKVFFFKGCKCVKCGVEGVQLCEGIDVNNNSKHIDVYTENMTMMTIDHIIPKGKGGSNSLDNLQPMCKLCNETKGNKNE